MSVPDLGALGRAVEKAASPVPSEVLYVNHVAVSVTSDGQVVLVLAYETPDGVVELREVVMPAALYLTRLADPAEQVLAAAARNLAQYTTAMVNRLRLAEEPPADGKTGRPPTPEELADARRRAAGDEPS